MIQNWKVARVVQIKTLCNKNKNNNKRIIVLLLNNNKKIDLVKLIIIININKKQLKMMKVD